MPVPVVLCTNGRAVMQRIGDRLAKALLVVLGIALIGFLMTTRWR